MALYNITTRDEFTHRVLDSDRVVLVDFWAEWCPPCRMMTPILESIAQTMTDVDIVKINVEASAETSQLASEYGVRGIPNMKLFKNGTYIKEIIGAQPQAVIEQELSAVA